MQANYKVLLKDGSTFPIRGVASFHYFEIKNPESNADELCMQFCDSYGDKIGHLVHSNVVSISSIP